MAVIGTVAAVGIAAAGGLVLAAAYRRKLAREQFIRSFMFPTGVFEKFRQAHPSLDVKQQQLVARALRQFFLVYLKSGRRRVAMPSQVVDDLWHEFILFTRAYQAFCNRAFGQFLHHTPAVKLGGVRSDNEGLRRAWWFSCLEENINPRKATRLPLLFALDRKLGIAGGFVYEIDCRRNPDAVREGGTSGAQCAEAFGESSFDGSTDGFGNSSGDWSFSVDVSDSGGCSGGCGGGD